jgi:hypothetical protein
MQTTNAEKDTVGSGLLCNYTLFLTPLCPDPFCTLYGAIFAPQNRLYHHLHNV